VNKPGTHHRKDCCLYRGSCRFCNVFGTRSQTERNGPNHAWHCTLYEGSCSHCGLRGTHHRISNEGLQHDEGCPLRPAVCNGCGIHSVYTVLQEPAGSTWTEVEPGEQLRVSPRRLRFCQDSVSRAFHDGTSVFDRRQGTPKISACFYEEVGGTRLFALNNRTLFNAIHTGLDEIIVNIVQKPEDWLRRFTASPPWMCMKVRGLNFIPPVGYVERQALRIPAAAFPGNGQQSICLVVLEVRNLVNSNKDTLYDLLKDMSSDLDARCVDGPHAFARVRVKEDDVPLIRSMVKAIAERKGKNVRAVDCSEVQGMRLYESPRD